ncbi:MAG: ethylbenzene dehydrogenase-related protein [Actinomycetota bacterium]
MVFTVSRRAWVIATIILGAIVAVGVAAYTIQWFLSRPPTVVARYVSKGPSIGGSKSDPLWNKATPQAVKIESAPDVVFQALYTKEKVFIRAVYEDATKDDVSQIWTYGNGAWTNGRAGDLLVLMFNINDSVKGFDERGSKVITLEPKTKRDVSPGGSLQLGWSFYINADKKDKTSLAQRADVWFMGVGVSNKLGQAVDEVFQINPMRSRSPYVLSTLIEVYPDALTGSWPVTINARDIHKLAPGQPRDMYRIGGTIETLPYPKVTDMIPITDYAGFKNGDNLPFIIFKGESWRGSVGDIEAHARWEKGRWTVEMARKLDTRHGDDIVFKPDPSGTVWYYFSPLVRTDGQRVRQGPSAILEFEPAPR